MGDPAHERWLTQLTALPSVAGREEAVSGWVARWARRRPDLKLAKDRSGNLYLTQQRPLEGRPIWLTAHMDHPGFVAVAVEGRRVSWEFRGGVLPAYYEGAVIEWLDGLEPVGRGRIDSVEETDRGAVGTALRLRGSDLPEVGSLGRWYFPDTRLGVWRGRLRAHACDDLAGVAAALSVLDRARSSASLGDVGVILTRAEEVGLVGAIAAAKGARIPAGSRLICLEMSRALPDAPVGGGPVVRVGDASSTFSPDLTNALDALARQLESDHGFAYQRKLMTGGTCEATAFLAYGHTAACVCLPLGNYHNMGHLDAVEVGTKPATVAPEEISLTDWHAMVDFLVQALGRLDEGKGRVRDRLDERFESARSVL